MQEKVSSLKRPFHHPHFPPLASDLLELLNYADSVETVLFKHPSAGHIFVKCTNDEMTSAHVWKSPIVQYRVDRVGHNALAMKFRHNEI